MDSLLDRGQMVGEHGDADGLFPSYYLIINWSDEPLVKILNGTKLQLEVAVVARLVAGLYVDENEVLRAQGVDGGLCLAFVVGIGKSCGTGNFNDIQAGVAADALYEVDGGDD